MPSFAITGKNFVLRIKDFGSVIVLEKKDHKAVNSIISQYFQWDEFYFTETDEDICIKADLPDAWGEALRNVFKEITGNQISTFKDILFNITYLANNFEGDIEKLYATPIRCYQSFCSVPNSGITVHPEGHPNSILLGVVKYEETGKS